MNYVITGKLRKTLKKKLSLLKYDRKMIYFFDDINQVYGLVTNDIDQKAKYLDDKIKDFEIKLQQTIQ